MSLRNFVTEEELKTCYPRLLSQLWQGNVSYQKQIDEAFERLNRDIWNSGQNPRQCMIPLDLNGSSSTVSGMPLVQTTISATTKGNAFAGLNQRRYVIESISHLGNWVFQLQGSNVDAQPTADNQWSNITEAVIELDSTDDEIEQSVTFEQTYKWYRNVATTASGSITFTVNVVENIWDQLITLNAFKLIFLDFVKTDGDVWQIRYNQAVNDYNAEFQKIRFTYDTQDTGKPTEVDENAQGAIMQMSR
jgi:hypothetical protein